MSSKLRTFIQHNWVLVSVFVAAFVLTMWFATRMAMDALYFNDPRNVDVNLKPWMTPRYIVLTYDLPRPFVWELLELDLETDQGIRLGRMSTERGISMEDLTTLVREAAAEYRNEQP